MTLQARALLLITSLLVLAVLATAAALAWISSVALLAQMEDDGVLIAHLLARGVEYSDDLMDDVRDMLDGQMIVQASLASQLVALGVMHDVSAEEMRARLREVTRHTTVDEIVVTDDAGRTYVHTGSGAGPTFSPDARAQPEASVFWPLLTGTRSRVVLKAPPRDGDAETFEYAGVGGADRPRIVRVAYQGQFLDRVRERVGMSRLVQDVVAGGNVEALHVVDRDLTTLAYNAVPGREAGQDLSAAQRASVRRVMETGDTTSRLDGDVLTVITPLVDATTGLGEGAALVQLSAAHIFEAQRHQLELTVLIAVLVLCVGVVANTMLARRVTRPVAQLTAAAAAIEAGTAVPPTLTAIAARADELGQFARVFERMAREVYAREARLQEQVQTLRIEIDQAKRARQVAEITETDYFQQLQQRARSLRERPPEPTPE